MNLFLIMVFYRNNRVPKRFSVSANNCADAIMRLFAGGEADFMDIFKIEIYPV